VRRRGDRETGVVPAADPNDDRSHDRPGGDARHAAPAMPIAGTDGAVAERRHGLTAAEVVERLGLRPHPEGGWYTETWRHEAPAGERPAGTAIYYLLAAGQRSHWHRVDAAEIWHHYAGDSLRLRIQAGDAPTHTVALGPDLAGGEVPQAVVPEGAWQAAEPTGAWSLVGCTVSPGFRFEGFELAPPDWSPPA
jgi:predicted cupin superfamily sugar epimerase